MAATTDNCSPSSSRSINEMRSAPNPNFMVSTISLDSRSRSISDVSASMMPRIGIQTSRRRSSYRDCLLSSASCTATMSSSGEKGFSTKPWAPTRMLSRAFSIVPQLVMILAVDGACSLAIRSISKLSISGIIRSTMRRSNFFSLNRAIASLPSRLLSTTKPLARRAFVQTSTI